MLRFVISHNDQPVKTYELDDQVITIGRLPENTISIANMGISRRHVKIERTLNNTYLVSDLNSLNGTLVNNKKIKKETLNSGDCISIGKYTIKVEEINSPDIPDSNNNTASIADTDHIYPDIMLQQNPGEILQNTDSTRGKVLIETANHFVHKIDKKILSVGNSEDDDIRISGFMVTTAYVFIEVTDNEVIMYSNKPTNKFKINGKKTNRQRLVHKDKIKIGNSVFRYMVNE